MIIRLYRRPIRVVDSELISRFCFFLYSKLISRPFSTLIKRKIFGSGRISTRLLQTDNLIIGSLWLRDGILMSFGQYSCFKSFAHLGMLYTCYSFIFLQQSPVFIEQKIVCQAYWLEFVTQILHLRIKIIKL
jgi:hypothetical protein